MSSTTVDVATATPKTIVRQVIDRMPENATFREIAEEIAILSALEDAEEDIREGRVSSQEEVKERARRWRSK